MGSCIFNNVAVAAELAIRELGLRRVLILDWDVHHGNGTAEIFHRCTDVLFANIHQARLYSEPEQWATWAPVTDVATNDPVAKGTDDEGWISVLDHVLAPIGRAFRSPSWPATCAT